MEKVRCSNCGNQTFRSSSCQHCGKPLVAEPISPREGAAKAAEQMKDQIERIKDEFGFVRRAADEAKNYHAIRIARFEAKLEAVQQGGQTGRIKVQRGTRKFVITTNMREPIMLRPGVYSVANLLLGSRDSDETQNWVCVCTVDDEPITATFVLPDESYLGENATVSSALMSLSLRTSDNLLGGVRLQMSLVCEDPVKLIRTFGDAHLGGARHDDDGGQQRNLGVYEIRQVKPPEEKPRFLTGKWFRNLFTGSSHSSSENEAEFHVRVESFTLADLYPRIRLELANVIRASIRNITARDLYDTVDVRNRVEEDIQRDMARTFETFGMRIDRVSAFQFLSPAYERLLEERAQLAIEEQRLEDRQRGAEVRKRGRVIEHGDIKDSMSSGAQLDQHQTTVTAQTRQVEDTVKAEQQERELAMEGARRQFAREQNAADDTQALQLQVEKARAFLQLQNEQRDAEQRRHIELISVYKDLPAEKLLEIAMTQYPHLAQAYVAAQQAMGLQAQIAMHQEFRKTVEDIFGQNNEWTKRLLLEGARQLGHVAGKKMKAQKSVVVTGEEAQKLLSGKDAEEPPSE